jgi:hypothetical protein
MHFRGIEMFQWKNRLDSAEKIILNSIYNYWKENLEWPNGAKIEVKYRTVFMNNGNLDNLVEKLGNTFIQYEKYQENPVIELTIFGIALCDNSDDDINLFLKLVKRLVKDFIKSLEEDSVKDQNDNQIEFNFDSNDYCKKVCYLLSSSGHDLFKTRPNNPLSSCRFTLKTDVWKFENVKTIEDYYEVARPNFIPKRFFNNDEIKDKTKLLSLKTAKKEFNVDILVNSVDTSPELLKDLELLIDICEKDMDKDLSVSWMNHVKSYNSILLKLQKLGYFESFELISNTLDATGYLKTAPYEQAKVSEVIYNSKRLSYRLQNFIDAKSIEINEIKDSFELIFSRFHKVAQQLEKRHKNNGIPRETLEITDEYDVQDLLHSLLRLYFDDISAEITVPGGASGHTIVDFLLKSEKTAIEVKKTRKGLSNVELRKQLNDDIPTYERHPDCNTLIFFIYDPENIIDNPIGFEKEFNDRTTNNLRIIVYITPK